jgi:hypothetical protein
MPMPAFFPQPAVGGRSQLVYAIAHIRGGADKGWGKRLSSCSTGHEK